MSGWRRLLAGLGIALAVVLVVAAVDRIADGTGGAEPDRSDQADGAEQPTTVPDDRWCPHWQAVAQVQGQYVVTQSADDAQTLRTLVEDLRDLGYPASLDPAGYPELDAVLDDLRASVDPSFTPTATPTEPADVPLDGDHDHGTAHDHGDVPFGSFLAEHCPA